MSPPAPAVLPPMPAVRARRCARHTEREAVARCPACGGAFCRECVVEHGGRLLCAACLAKEAAEAAAAARPAPQRLPAAGRALGLATGGLALWLLFYALGALLLKIPPAFHDGAIWQHPDQASDQPEDAP